jgi:hypothetical protein
MAAASRLTLIGLLAFTMVQGLSGPAAGRWRFAISPSGWSTYVAGTFGNWSSGEMIAAPQPGTALYGQRWQAQSAFSRHRRRPGSVLGNGPTSHGGGRDACRS